MKGNFVRFYTQFFYLLSYFYSVFYLTSDFEFYLFWFDKLNLFHLHSQNIFSYPDYLVAFSLTIIINLLCTSSLSHRIFIAYSCINLTRFANGVAHFSKTCTFVNNKYFINNKCRFTLTCMIKNWCTSTFLERLWTFMKKK